MAQFSMKIMRLHGSLLGANQQLKALEDENGKLKRLLADTMLDMSAMRELLAKKW